MILLLSLETRNDDGSNDIQQTIISCQIIRKKNILFIRIAQVLHTLYAPKKHYICQNINEFVLIL